MSGLYWCETHGTYHPVKTLSQKIERIRDALDQYRNPQYLASRYYTPVKQYHNDDDDDDNKGYDDEYDDEDQDFDNEDDYDDEDLTDIDDTFDDQYEACGDWDDPKSGGTCDI